ncbi:MAG: T9SS C-terminal target domain-containing protein, partial [Bacteroidetes bacterium]
YAQCDDTRLFIFGHSLIDHRPPAIPTPSDETTVPHWLYLLSQAAGTSFAAGGQYGFLPQHANVPPISQWGYDLVPGVWESDTESFGEADINKVLLTAGNFMQWQGPDQEYPSDPGITPISATETIMDWVNAQEEGVEFYIYENWPDMAPFANDAFPPTAEGLADYYAYTRGTWHEWWLAYQDALLASRPATRVRMIPVGPILSGIFTTQLSEEIPVTELYEDNAPHGRPTLYFLASMITYSALCQQPPPANFVVPNIVHPVIRDNYAGLADYIWQELNAFKDSSGNSRVFFTSTHTTKAAGEHALRLHAYPNPASNQLTISGWEGEARISLYDVYGREVLLLPSSEPGVSLDLSAYAPGSYLLKVQTTDSKPAVLVLVKT